MTPPRKAVTSLALLFLALYAACETRPESKHNAAETSVRRDVNLTMQKYVDAARAIDADASVAFYTPTGVLFEPGISPIQSPDSIRAFIKSFRGVQVDSATMVADTIEVFGNTAMVWGSYFEKLRFVGQPPSTQRGRFVMEWVQQANRSWLIERYYRIPLPDAPISTASPAKP
ncbi:MAG: nuclear transport factor 2 family protein [Gemmatimonadaceae bacterium]